MLQKRYSTLMLLLKVFPHVLVGIGISKATHFVQGKLLSRLLEMFHHSVVQNDVHCRRKVGAMLGWNSDKSMAMSSRQSNVTILGTEYIDCVLGMFKFKKTFCVLQEFNGNGSGTFEVIEGSVELNHFDIFIPLHSFFPRQTLAFPRHGNSVASPPKLFYIKTRASSKSRPNIGGILWVDKANRRICSYGSGVLSNDMCIFIHLLRETWLVLHCRESSRRLHFSIVWQAPNILCHYATQGQV